jgi:hypothetical protein
VGFEPTIAVFERAKTVHALVRAATAIGAVTYTKTQTDAASGRSEGSRNKYMKRERKHFHDSQAEIWSWYKIRRNWGSLLDSYSVDIGFDSWLTTGYTEFK